jgi:hypothetical protein
VSSDTIATTVCADGYAAPADQIPKRARRMVFASYRITPRDRGRNVIDLLVPRALGGSDGLGNLRAQLRREVAEKDAIEAALHQLVCAQHVDLVVAQRAITADWRTARQVADGAAEQRRAAVAAYLAEVASRSWSA